MESYCFCIHKDFKKKKKRYFSCCFFFLQSFLWLFFLLLMLILLQFRPHTKACVDSSCVVKIKKWRLFQKGLYLPQIPRKKREKMCKINEKEKEIHNSLMKTLSTSDGKSWNEDKPTIAHRPIHSRYSGYVKSSEELERMELFRNCLMSWFRLSKSGNMFHSREKFKKAWKLHREKSK